MLQSRIQSLNLTDGLFKVDYHLEHSDVNKTEEGMLKVMTELREGKWHTNIKTGLENTIIPCWISNLEVDIESDSSTMFNAKYINPTFGPHWLQNLDVKIFRTSEQESDRERSHMGVWGMFV